MATPEKSTTPNTTDLPITIDTQDGDACPAGPLCQIVAKIRPSIPFAIAETGAVFGWYAMPDVIRSRPARTAAKVGLLGGILAAEAWRNRETLTYLREVWVGSLDESPSCEGCEEPTIPAPEDEATAPPSPNPALLLGAGLATVGATIAVAVAAERWLFRRGERGRARGITGAHTRQAAWLAALTGAVIIADEMLLSCQEQDECDSCCGQ